MKKIIIMAMSLLLTNTAVSMAQDLSFIRGIGQSSFKSFSHQAGAAISYKNTAPAEPLGLTGFDIGVELTAVDIKKDADFWQAAFGNDAPSFLLLPKLRARKGLFWGIDVGAMYSYVPDSNIKLYGFEVSKAILEGSAVTPALGIRGSYTKLAGVNDLDLQTAGVDATLSKGLLILTPYLGAGAVYVNSKATGQLQSLSTSLQGGVPLKTEEFWQPRYFAGLKITPLPLIGVTAEVEYQERMIYSLKAALNF